MNGSYNIAPVVVPHFFSAEECKHVKKHFRTGAKISGRLRPQFRSDPAAPAEHEIRRSTICWLNDTARTAWIFERVRGLILNLNHEYFRFDVTDLQPIQLARYRVTDAGEFYGPHMDICTAATGSQRKLSLSVQLSLPDEYEGGDLLLFGDQNDRILDPANLQKNLFHRRQLGTAILFPSFFAHEVSPVTKGVRYSLVAWMEGPNWK